MLTVTGIQACKVKTKTEILAEWHVTEQPVSMVTPLAPAEEEEAANKEHTESPPSMRGPRRALERWRRGPGVRTTLSYLRSYRFIQ